jgi:hypothetical protein
MKKYTSNSILRERHAMYDLCTCDGLILSIIARSIVNAICRGGTLRKSDSWRVSLAQSTSCNIFTETTCWETLTRSISETLLELTHWFSKLIFAASFHYFPDTWPAFTLKPSKFKHNRFVFPFRVNEKDNRETRSIIGNVRKFENAFCGVRNI